MLLDKRVQVPRVEGSGVQGVVWFVTVPKTGSIVWSWGCAEIGFYSRKVDEWRFRVRGKDLYIYMCVCLCVCLCVWGLTSKANNIYYTSKT